MKTYVLAASLFLLVILLGFFRNKRAKKDVISVVDDACTGCGRCVKRCSHKALEMVEGGNGRRAALKRPEKCTACKDCIAVCKFDALELVSRENESIH